MIILEKRRNSSKMSISLKKKMQTPSFSVKTKIRASVPMVAFVISLSSHSKR